MRGHRRRDPAALTILLTLTNLVSVKAYGEFEFWFASIKVAAIVAFICLALAYVFGLTGGEGGVSQLTAEGGFAPEGFGMVLTGVVIVFYVLSVFLIVAIQPWNSTQLGESPFVAVLETIGIGGAADVMNAVVLTAVLSCLNSGLYVASRMMFTLAHRGDAPQWTVQLNARGVPARAILLATSVAGRTLTSTAALKRGPECPDWRTMSRRPRNPRLIRHGSRNYPGLAAYSGQNPRWFATPPNPSAAAGSLAPLPGRS